MPRYAFGTPDTILCIMTYKKTNQPNTSIRATGTGQIAVRSKGDRVFIPAIITDLGDNAAKRFLEFFTANIRNKNTRAA